MPKIAILVLIHQNAYQFNFMISWKLIICYKIWKNALLLLISFFKEGYFMCTEHNCNPAFFRINILNWNVSPFLFTLICLIQFLIHQISDFHYEWFSVKNWLMKTQNVIKISMLYIEAIVYIINLGLKIDFELWLLLELIIIKSRIIKFEVIILCNFSA